jgi:hypothetical protein
MALFAAIAVSNAARATDNHDYARGEYAVIRDGLAPDKRLSLASHGDGDLGYAHFHVWLMAEPQHRRIIALDGIAALLDTGPDAYRASWAPDSRHVAVSWRSDRHIAELNLYAVTRRGVHAVTGRALFRDVTDRDVGRHDDMRSGYIEISWTGPKRFVLREHRMFLANPGFVKSMGRFGKLGERRDDGATYFISFSAEAVCELLPGNRYRIVDLKPGVFPD